jgi:hypothetical protein
MKKGRFKATSQQIETPKRYEMGIAIIRGDAAKQGRVALVQRGVCRHPSLFLFV